MSAIEIRQVTHTYQSERGHVDALENVDLTIEKGEFVSIIGPSGSGKSTLLNLIAGLLRPTKGSILVDGFPADTQAGPPIGFVFQDPALLPWRDTKKNILLPLEMRGGYNEVEERIGSLIDLVGLQGFEHAYPNELSGGMRSRVSVARALSIQPPLLLMDEPFGSLDELTAQTIGIELLRILNLRPTTVVLVTHNISQAVFLSDRIIFLSDRPGHVANSTTINLGKPRTWETLDSIVFQASVAEVRGLFLLGRQAYADRQNKL